MSRVTEVLGISDSDLAEARKTAAVRLTGEFGDKYQQYLDRVSAALLQVYPPAAGYSPEELRDVVSIVAVCGTVSRGAKKRLKEACTGCGWCCSRTGRIIVEE